jgi:DeoR/GlpR family transcriptional regulator of sugar metabolism
MNKKDRHQQIIAMLKHNNYISVAELAEKFDTTVVTIRRDLDMLEHQKIINRIHGGAVLQETEHVLPTFTERLRKNSQEKQAIAREAIKLIHDEQIICLDDSTSALTLLNYFPFELQASIITTGLKTAVELCRFPNIEVIIVGGTILHATYTSSSVLATSFIRQFNADISFLSTRAINTAMGTYESNIDLVEEKRTVSSIGRKTVLLADNTKFERRSMCQSLQMQDIDILITDSNTPSAIIKEIRRKGVEVIVAALDA